MPISPLTLQRRFAELGRIRLGAKEGGKGRPMKLAAFRFTSPNQRYINDLATLYGGQAKPWDNNGKPEHEVFTDATSIPVIAMKGGLSQWMETWSGGGCIHRCDGEVNALTGDRCDPDDRAHRDAKPTTRLSLMLPELEAIGAWRMESHGWNAAAEIPAVAELAQFVGDLVPASLNMIERRSVRDGKTSRFVVPVLDLQIGTARLREIVAAKAGTTTELEAPTAGERPALAAAPAASNAPARPDYETRAAEAGTVDAVRALWKEAHAAGHLDEALTAVLTEKGNALQAAEQAARAAESSQEPDEDGAVDAELVDDPLPEPTVSATPAASEADGDVEWQKVLKAAGDRGMSLDDLNADFRNAMGGLIPDEASGSEIAAYLRLLTTGEEPAA